MARENTMSSQKNLVGIFLCLVCGLSFGDIGWPPVNEDLSDEEIRRQVDHVLQLVDQPTFQGWNSDLLKQAIPRMHIGLVELWLQFRKLQKEQDETWRKMMKISRLSAESCQDLKDKVAELSNHVPERMDMIEKHMKTIKMRVEIMEGVYNAESINRTNIHTSEPGNQQGENQTSSKQSGQRTQNATGHRKGKVSTTQLAHKVAVLTELLNGHNELLVELYDRVTALEGTQIRGHAAHQPPEGSRTVQQNAQD